MPTKAHYHLHVNLFQSEIPQNIREYLEHRTFKIAPYQILENNVWAPLWICTAKKASEEEISSLFNEIHNYFSDSPGFTLNGYMEAERLTHGNVLRVADGLWKKGVPFPIRSKPKFISASRGADIHIFRAKRGYYDQLDQLLASLGFYLVQNERQEIWTLLTEDYGEAQELFQQLKKYFIEARGVIKIEVEEILENKLQPFSKNFIFRPVVAKAP